MEENSTLKNVPNGECFKIDFIDLDDKTKEYLDNIMINEGDIIQVIKRVPELGNDSMIVKNKNGNYVILHNNYASKCYGFIIEEKEIVFEEKRMVKKIK